MLGWWDDWPSEPDIILKIVGFILKQSIAVLMDGATKNIKRPKLKTLTFIPVLIFILWTPLDHCAERSWVSWIFFSAELLPTYLVRLLCQFTILTFSPRKVLMMVTISMILGASDVRMGNKLGSACVFGKIAVYHESISMCPNWQIIKKREPILCPNLSTTYMIITFL